MYEEDNSELHKLLKRWDRTILVIICRKLGIKKTSIKGNKELRISILRILKDKSATDIDSICNYIKSILTSAQRSGKMVRSKKRCKLKQDRNNDSYVMRNKSSFFPQVERLIAIGDLHGDLEATILSLKKARVISDNIDIHEKDIKKIHWTGGETIVVQLGDQIDRVRPSELYQNLCRPDDPELIEDEGNDLKIMCLFDMLDKEAREVNGRCISIIGNHEMMNVDGDFRYVSPKEFCEFGNYFRSSQSPKNRTVPFGYMERKNAFCPGGVLAMRMAAYRYCIVQVGSWLFVHGYIHPAVAKYYSISKINKCISDWLLNIKKNDDKDIEFLYHNEDDSISPFWSRIYSEQEDCNNETENQFNQTIQYINEVNKDEQIIPAKGMIIGHSPQFMYNKPLNSGFDGRVWRVDVGVSRAFGKHENKDTDMLRKVQVLEILNDKTFNVLS